MMWSKGTFTTIMLLLVSLSGFSQVNIPFGKNRVQFHNFEWFQYETPNFVTYYQRKDQMLGKAAMMIAESELNSIEKLLETNAHKSIALVVYTDQTDILMSNIGNEEPMTNSAGTATVVSDKIFVHFTGSHDDLKRQIREGIAKVLMNHLLFGTNLQEIVQNAVLMNLPEWYTEGVLAYAAEPWNTTLDNEMRDIMISGSIQRFQDLVSKNPRLAGHSFWYYIAQTYGKNAVSNLLYLTRINHSIESGFLYVTGSNDFQVMQGWMTFFFQSSQVDTKQTLTHIGGDSIAIAYPKRKKNLQYYNAQISADGHYTVYAENEIGRVKIHLYDNKKKEDKIIWKYGSRNALQATDYNYPLLSFSPSGKEVSIFYERRDQIWLTQYNISKEESVKKNVEGIERITSADCIDSKWYVISGIQDGFSGLWRYSPSSGLKKLTYDFYDYKDAAYTQINGVPGVLFTSNRTSIEMKPEKFDSIMPLGTHDVFFMKLGDTSKTKELVRLTNTPNAEERMPLWKNNREFSYLSDEAGRYNRYVGHIDTLFAYNEQIVKLKTGDSLILHQDSLIRTPLEQIDTTYLKPIFKPFAFSKCTTNYDIGILQHSIARNSGQTLETWFKGQKVQARIITQDTINKEKPAETIFRRFSGSGNATTSTSTPTKTPQKETPKKIDFSEDVDTTVVVGKDTFNLSPTVKPDTAAIDIDNYEFQTDFEDVSKPDVNKRVKPEYEDTAAQLVRDAEGNVMLQAPEKTDFWSPNAIKQIKWKLNRSLPYKTSFKYEDYTISFDNSLLYNGLQDYSTSTSQYYNFPPLGVLIKSGIKDVMEDYRLDFGIRIPLSFNGMEYFIDYQNLKKRWDKKWSIYRKNSRNNAIALLPDGTTKDVEIRNFTHLAQAKFSYPFDVFRSIRLTGVFRTDKIVPLSQDLISLSLTKKVNNRIGFETEYVFDNTVYIDHNILNGTRYKLYATIYNRFRADVTAGDVDFSVSDAIMGAVGGDFRHYFRLDKHSIFAVRGAFATSFGSEKMLYYLGGVENGMGSSPNENIPTPTNGEDFGYKAFAGNLRGFQNNIRNGNSYALFNAEFRFPVLKYLSDRPLKSNLLKNLQLIAFLDGGTAWQGISPFDDDNPLNSQTFGNDPITVTVKYFRNPIVYGFGAGVRTTILSYFIKLDYGWGIETGMIQPSRWHLSVGYDF